MALTNDFFDDDERLCRAVFHPSNICYIKENGKFSSAVFKSKNGLSVDRSANRNNREIVGEFIKRKSIHDYSAFALITVSICRFCTRDDLDPAKIVYKPLDENKYHTEIYRNYDNKRKIGESLTDGQAKYLANNAILLKPDVGVK